MKALQSNRSKKFFQKMFFSFLSAVFFITLILVCSISYNYIHMALNMVYQFSDQLLAQTNYSMIYVDDLAKRLSNTLYADEEIVAFLNSEDEDIMNSIRTMERLRRHMLPLNYVESIYLYNAGKDLFISTTGGEQSSAEEFYDKEISDYIKNSTKNTSAPIYHIVNREKATALCSYVIFDVNSHNPDLYNAIVINVDATILTKSIQEMMEYQPSSNTSEYMVMDEKGNLMESTIDMTSIEKENLLSVLQPYIDRESFDQNSSPLYINIGNVNYLVSLNNNNDNGWYIVGLTPREMILSEVFHTSLIALLLVFGVVIIAAIVIYGIARKLYTPVQNITAMAMKHTGTNITTSKQQDEFQYLITAFQSIQRQNEQFLQFKRETSDSARQSFIDTLLSGTNIVSEEKMKQRLEVLNLSYLLKGSLCMVLLKIDRYNDFYSSNNQKERWAMRYAIVNIVSEVSTRYFPSEIFSRQSDKFILLIQCDENDLHNDLKKKIETMLQEIQKNVHLIHLTVSAAYSTVFQGIKHFFNVYNNLEDMIKLKIHYGHECIITPYMADEINTDSFQKPVQENSLIEQICVGRIEEARPIYGEILSQLSQYSYEEISVYMLHLGYSVCLAVQAQNPVVRQEVTEKYKRFMTEMEKCEVFSDITELTDRYFSALCELSKQASDNSHIETGEYIAQKVCDIIEKNYQRKDLCLSTIAEEIGLSPNYVGQLFKQVQGVSVSKYMMEFRMEKMGHYLRTTSLSSSEIIDKIGLEKNNYLYTCFKKHFGLSLSEYKLKYGYQEAEK